MNITKKQPSLYFKWLFFYQTLLMNLFSIMPGRRNSSLQTPFVTKRIQINWRSKLKTPNVPKDWEKRIAKPLIVWQLFLNLYQNSFSSSLPFFKPQGFFKAFFFFNFKDQPVCINYSKLYKRWVNTFNLLFNLFYYNSFPLIFSSKIFRSEVLSFNWSLKTWEYSFFKRVAPYFFLEDTCHGESTQKTYHCLAQHTNLFSFVTNVTYHEKNLQFLKKFNAYTIGVVSINTTPWLLSYPIIVGTNELLAEYYFLSFLSFLRQYVSIIHYNELLMLWKLI